MTVCFTHIDDMFSLALANLFESDGSCVTTDPSVPADFFIDTTNYRDPADIHPAGAGVDGEVLFESFRKNVTEPLALLEKVLPNMKGKRRICFLTTRDASINWSEARAGFGLNMAKAALHQTLTITKNGLRAEGYTFRLFDPMSGSISPERAAASAYVYFTRDRFDEGPENPSRDDENNLIVRDALGREIPW